MNTAVKAKYGIRFLMDFTPNASLRFPGIVEPWTLNGYMVVTDLAYFVAVESGDVITPFDDVPDVTGLLELGTSDKWQPFVLPVRNCEKCRGGFVYRTIGYSEDCDDSEVFVRDKCSACKVRIGESDYSWVRLSALMRFSPTDYYQTDDKSRRLILKFDGGFAVLCGLVPKGETCN